MNKNLKSFKKITCILGITFLLMGMVPLPAIMQATPITDVEAEKSPSISGLPGLNFRLSRKSDGQTCSNDNNCDSDNCYEGTCRTKVNCAVSDWGPCSAKCEGGTQTRTIDTAPLYGGTGCPALSQDCNTQACEQDPPPTDSDGDGEPDASDGCPNDANKTSPGACGCGSSETDSDSDRAPDCMDGCPDDPGKVAAGACGCGAADTDTDGDGVEDCNDPCPEDADDECSAQGSGDECPANSHQQGSNCTCDDGFVGMPDGQCVASCPSCYELTTNGKYCQPSVCSDSNAHCEAGACACNDGYDVNDAGVCVAPNDMCPNIWGIQETVPAGMEVNANGDCTPEGHTQQDHKIVICHVPPGNPDNPQTLSISIDAWKSDCNGVNGACHCPGCHGGDYLGACTSGGPVCGDDTVEGSEQCDGSLRDGQYPDGSYCTEECTIYTPPTCGDNEINQEEGEVCDGSAGVNQNETCADDCSVVYTCGDGEVNQRSEDCDGEAYCTDDCTLKESALLILDPYCIDEDSLQWTVENNNGFAVPNVSVNLDGATTNFNPLGTGTTFIGITGDGPNSHTMTVTWPDGSDSLSSTLDCATTDDDDDDDTGGGGNPPVVFNAPIPVTAAGGPTEELVIIPVTGLDLMLDLTGLQQLFTYMGLMMFGVTMMLEGVDRKLHKID